MVRIASSDSAINAGCLALFKQTACSWHLARSSGLHDAMAKVTIELWSLFNLSLALTQHRYCNPLPHGTNVCLPPSG